MTPEHEQVPNEITPKTACRLIDGLSIRFVAPVIIACLMAASGAAQTAREVGHIHVTVDDATWHWADASGNPVIINGLAPGPHTILIQLVNANHQPVDQEVVRVTVPKRGQ